MAFSDQDPGSRAPGTLAGWTGSLYRAQLLDAITILRATRYG
jgi:hypothetical protein